MPKKAKHTLAKSVTKAETAAEVTAAATASLKLDSLEPLPAAGEVVLHEGLTLLEVADAADLSAIQADARLKDFILARLSPTEAVVLPQHSQPLIKALLKAGHTPRVD